MMHKQILPILLGSLCFLSGCNTSPATNDIPDDTAQNAVMSESETFPTQQDSKEEISEATEHLAQSYYEEIYALYGENYVYPV